jgi:hypothetical protein
LAAHIEGGKYLRVFENGVLRRIFGPKTDEVTGEWRQLHDEELLTNYCSGDQIEKNEMGWECSRYRETRGVYSVLVGKSEGKGPLERPRRRWEDNIKMDLQEVWMRGHGLDRAGSG